MPWCFGVRPVSKDHSRSKRRSCVACCEAKYEEADEEEKKFLWMMRNVMAVLKSVLEWMTKVGKQR